MVDTGWILPGTGSLDTSIGTETWDTPGSITTIGGTSAVIDWASGTKNSYYLRASNFGFSIPSGATIDGIEVRYLRRENSTTDNLETKRIRLVDDAGTVRTTDRAVAGEWPLSLTLETVGDATDQWGESAGFWTPDKINSSNFGVAIQAGTTGSGTTPDGEVDYVQVRVHYTEATGTVTKTTSLNALLQRQAILQTASASASLQKQGVIITASIGSALSKTISPTSNLGAALLKQGLLRTTVANAFAQKQGLIRTTNVDAALAKAFSAASSLNASLQKATQVIASTEALLQKNPDKSSSVQGLIEKRELILTSTLNAAVQKTVVLTASLNAVLNGSVTPQVTASVNALLQKLVQANASLNALLSKQGIVSVASANAVLQKAGIGKVALASAVLSKTASLNASLSAIIQQSLLLNAGLSAVLQKPAIPLAVSADGLLERRNLARTASLQAVLQKNIGAIAMLNAVLQKRMTATAQANGLALKPGFPVIAAIDGVIVVFEALTAHHMVTPAKQTYPRSKPKQQPTKPIRGGLVRSR